ncbi:MAG: FMN-binding protein [Sedimentisphaerales bacterium]
MVEKRWFPVVYMFTATALVSSIVLGLTGFTAQRVKANEKLTFEKAVLSVLPGVYDQSKKIPGLELHKIFTENVSLPDDSSFGAYLFKQNGQIIAYALPFEGQGFWAPIKGIIGILPDKKTITGIAFYEQNETPGLGAEIAKPQFRNQFKGKVIKDGEKPFTIARPDVALDESSVHAITGATQTSTRLEAIINNDLKNWQEKMK